MIFSRRDRYLVILLVSLLVVPIGAQTSITVQGEPVSARITAASSTAPEAQAYERLVAESIGVVLVRSGFAVDTTPSGEVLSWEYSILSLIPRLHLSLSVRDERTGTLISSASGSARTNVTLFNSVDDIVSATVNDVTAYLALRDGFAHELRPTAIAGVLPPLSPRFDGESVVVQPHAPLSGDSAEGVLLADGVTVPVSARGPGHYPIRSITGVEGAVPTPRPYQRLGVQLHTSIGRLAGAGIGARYGIIPDRLTAGTEFDIYASGAGRDTPYSVLHGEARVLAEYTMWDWGRVSLRVSTGVGGVITTFLSGLAAPYFDLYWNVVNVMPVFRTGRQFWFARLGANYTIETERGFLSGGVGEGAPQVFVGTYRRF